MMSSHSWTWKLVVPPKGGLRFGVFSKKVQQINHVDKIITHTPDTLHAIPLGVLNCLEKLTLRKPNFYSIRVYSVYPNHTNALWEVGLAPYILPTIGEFWKGQDEKRILTKKMNLMLTKKQKYLFLLHTHVFSRLSDVRDSTSPIIFLLPLFYFWFWKIKLFFLPSPFSSIWVRDALSFFPLSLYGIKARIDLYHLDSFYIMDFCRPVLEHVLFQYIYIILKQVALS